MPTTTGCPYLPGQTVNTLAVPTQKSLRQRSASLSSMRITDYQAIDPQAKFITPHPAPQTPSDAAATRKRTAPGFLRHAASSRSLSPSPAWRRLFSHKGHNDERGRSRDRDDQSVASVSTYEASRSPASSRSRNRSMSPESLRRFLSDDIPTRPGSNLSERPALVIPEDIAEENEDDDNFATSAVSEAQPFTTGLSPPPFQRSTSEAAALTIKNLSSLTLNTERPASKQQTPAVGVSSATETPVLEPASQPRGSNFTSATSSAQASPLSATTPDYELLTFYDDSNDDDVLSHRNSDALPIQHPLQSRFTGYSLPPQNDEVKTKLEVRPTFGSLHPPQLITPGDAGSYPPTASGFLPTPIDTSVDDFASELGWMVHSIGTKD